MLTFRFHWLYRRYRPFTMIPKSAFIDNLRLVHERRGVPGAVVECGVWRGGMSAAVADVLGPGREYYLFDSFEGLPPAKEIDGPAAQAWQRDTGSAMYFDNCRAEMEHAQRAMAMSAARKIHMHKGWFADTVPSFPRETPIAVLRLDGDWYESTMQCLTHLYPRVSEGGLIIVDDYYVWDGCARAVHDYLAKIGSASRIRQSRAGVCYFIKAGDTRR